MRRTLFFLLISLASLANADRLITIPRGGKIPFGTVRGEFMFQPSDPTSTYSFFGVGLTTFIDAEVESDQLKDEEKFTALNLDFNVNAPIAGYAPGISVGVLDATDQSPERRRGYLAVSWQDNGGAGPLSGAATVETTLGVMVGHTTHFFIGASLPVTEQFRLLVEDNGTVLSSGAEFRTTFGPYVRLVFREDQTLLSVGETTHF